MESRSIAHMGRTPSGEARYPFPCMWTFFHLLCRCFILWLAAIAAWLWIVSSTPVVRPLELLHQASSHGDDRAAHPCISLALSNLHLRGLLISTLSSLTLARLTASGATVTARDIMPAPLSQRGFDLLDADARGGERVQRPYTKGLESSESSAMETEDGPIGEGCREAGIGTVSISTLTFFCEIWCTLFIVAMS